MYDELIKNLRGMAKGFCPFDRGNKMCGYFVTQEAADAIEGLSHAVDQMTEWRKNRWIPVTERLPEHSGNYLVYSIGGKWKQLSTIEIAFWNDKNFIVQSFFAVTHWMPLPEPPKDGE